MKQRAIASVKSNRNKLNSSALLKEDAILEPKDNTKNPNSPLPKDDNINTNHTFCRGIITNIANNVIKDKTIKKQKQNLAELRALALKSLLTPTTSSDTSTNTNTSIVDMDISPNSPNSSPNVSPETSSTASKESIKVRNESESEKATFSAETQKLSLILSQLRKKDEERQNLAMMAKQCAAKLHVYVDKLDLSFDFHQVLDKMIFNHIKCRNCSANETKQILELQRQKRKYKANIKRLLKKLKPQKKKKKIERIEEKPREIILLDETMEELHIDECFGINDKICLSDIYDMENNKCLDHELIKKQHKTLIESKIDKNLLLYYIQV